ncbi:uncharacterized protein LOC133919077 [Phragmites australis]|uniref:uncharacterized protein LOC133919077 n=1 Tax=Phragmites australis TaxID=29695 RepID=UPI002D79A50F|nr:uncharacterized protein LOC133919077 [Phragmites australis]
MEEPGTGTRGREDHHVAVPRFSGEDGVSVAAAPEPGDGLGDGEEVCGAQGRGLSTEEEGEKGGDLAVGLVDPVEAVCAILEGRRCQIGDEKGSSSEERPMNVEEEKGGSLAFAPQASAEPGSLRTCHEGNGGLSDKTLCVPCGEAVCSEDVGCMYEMLDKVTDGSQCELEDLADNVGDWGGLAEVMTSTEDLWMASEEAHCDNECLLDLTKHGSEQQPRGVDGVRSVTDANNELQHDDLMPNIEAEVFGPLYEDSVPSVSRSIDVSLDGKTVQFGQISGDSVTSHVADGSLWNNKGLCAPFGEGSQFIDAGCMYDTVDMATEGSPCQQGSLAGDGGVLSGGAYVKTSLEGLEMCCKEPHCDGKGLSDLVKLDIEHLPYGMAVTCLNKNANHDLEKDDLLPKVGAEDSCTLHEDSFPSLSGSSVAVSLDGKAGQVGELSERRAITRNMSFGSQEGGTLSCESVFHKEAPGGESRCSRREVNISEEDLRTGWMEVAHDNGDLSDPGKCHTEKFPCGVDGLTLITGANHEPEKVGFLPNIDAAVSCPVDEASVPSIYGSSIDVPLDEKASQIGYMSERSSCVEKLARNSLEGDTLLCESGLRTEAYGDENQESSMGVSNRLNLSVCKASIENLEACGPYAVKEMQQISQKSATAELPPEIDLCHSSYNQPCNNEPCSGRESSAQCMGHQDSGISGIGGSGPIDHLDQGLNACNSADDKASSVDFVCNANDGESQSQKLATFFVFRRRNPKRAASSRNLNSEKPDQINKASSGTRKLKKVDIASSLHQSTMGTFPNKISKGRSGMNRPQKSSAWGSRQKLLDGFCQSHGPLASNSRPIYLGKGRSNTRSDQRNQPSFRKSRSSRSSKSKCSTLSDVGHLADELNGKPAFSAIADTDASSEGQGEDIPKFPSHSLECTDCPNTQQLKRGLASSTQETCPAYIHGECAKLSTSGPSLTNDNGTVMLPVGFSPDSVLEVASVTCESNASASHDVMLHENSSDAGALNGGGHHPSVLSTSKSGKDQAPSLMHLEQRAKTAGGIENTRKEETGPSHAMIDNDVEGRVQTLQKSNTVKKNSTVRKLGCMKKDGTKGKNLKTRSSTQISSCEASQLRGFSNDSVSPDPPELLLSTGHPELGSCCEVQTSATQDLGTHEHGNTQNHSVIDSEKGSAFHTMKSPRHKKKDANAGKKGKVRDPHMKGKGKKKNIADGTSLDDGLFNLPSTELAASHMNEQGNLTPATELAFKNSGTISTALPGNVAYKMDEASVPPPPPAAWVCCDDCQKWRCIPAELADAIGETNCRWTCKDNGDMAFADCSIPQVKTNAEINAELELSDASADEADNDGSNSKASRAPSWTHVRSNLFLHRNRRTQSIDESMVCNCKPPQDGRMGCRDGCLNRMLNIECVKRTCPCEEQCSNQKFQRRSYAKLRWCHSGNKGYGLQLQEDVSEGRFLIEYVGEVLDITSYKSRQRYYASKGQKHFYFMALNGGEVIDACTKGNLGRFINHSCSPNCRTEKWMVNGEVCIGIFAMRNIKKGEELTFDYNYVRVSGAAPQKCFCGTAKCRGYIGGDISVDSITQDDAEAGHFEQMVVDKNSEELMGASGSGSDGSHPNIVEPEFSIQEEDLHDCPAANTELEPLQQTGGTEFETNEPENSLEAWSPQEDEDAIRTPVHVSRTIESSLQCFPVHGTLSSDCLPKTSYTTEGSKAPNVINGSPNSDFRSNLVPGFNGNKRNNLKHHRNVKPSSSSLINNEHILGVEGRLNNLLDEDGGISKRKDATNGYLKLLFVTAAEGDSADGTSKSVRDLSLILDALLKTKSHSVLLDIVNKNGLQMLHNILKQNRSNFHRIPIIRKLLKVLEFLAVKRILTSEHINGGPRCAGVESFRDSMLRLTRHSNFQVHQSAWNFLDRWIPRDIARSEPTEYPRASTSAQDNRGANMVWNSSGRKRKSRWDYQPDEHYKMVGLKILKAYSEHGEPSLQIGLMRNKLQGNQGTNSYHNDVPGMGSSTESADDEVPPGFESQQERRPVQASFDCEVAPGLCMERYQPSLTISYGIPVDLVQHFGTPESERQCHQKWKVAPAVPFIPFPPLPPYPRGSPSPSTSSYQMSQHDGTSTVKHNSSGHCGRTADTGGRVHRTWRNGPRTRWPYNNQGRRFPSNHHRFERFHPSSQ